MVTDERGQVLGGRYEVQERIGRGGAGVVYRAWDRRLRRTVAVKLLAERVADDPTAVQRLEREARAAAGLASPHVVAVFDIGLEANRPYLVMEYVPGGSLAERVAGRAPLPAERVADHGRQIAAGLAAAHARGLVHRDVTLRNVLAAPDGTLKLTDFGIARAAGEPALTRSGVALGTPIAMAPEQVRGEAVSPATDVYGLGVALYELATGRRPFTGASDMAVAVQHLQAAPPPPSRLNPALPAWLEAIILQALAKEPAARYPDGAAIEAALLAGPAGGDRAPAAAPVASARSATTRFSRRPPATALGATPSTADGPLPTASPARPAEHTRPLARPRWRRRPMALLLGALLALALVGALVAQARLAPSAPPDRAAVAEPNDALPGPVSATAPPGAEPNDLLSRPVTATAPPVAVVSPTPDVPGPTQPAIVDVVTPLAAPMPPAASPPVPSPTPPAPATVAATPSVAAARPSPSAPTPPPPTPTERPAVPPPAPTVHPPSAAPTPAPKAKDDASDKENKEKGKGTENKDNENKGRGNGRGAGDRGGRVA